MRVVPSTKKASTELITMRVWRAWTEAGRRKLPTPLEMASRPVNDEPPLAKARRRVMKASPINQPWPGVPRCPPNRLLSAGTGMWWRSPRAFLT
jgi:hypothetical protein